MGIRDWLDQSARIAELESENESLKATCEDFDKTITSRDKTIRCLSTQIQGMKDDYFRRDREAEEMAKTIEDRNQEITFLKKTIDGEQKRIADAEQTIESQNATIADLTDRNWWLRDRMKAVEAQAERKQDERVEEAMELDEATKAAQDALQKHIDTLLTYDPYHPKFREGRENDEG